MPEVLKDWPDPSFSDFVLAKHPAPMSPATGEPAWEQGIRLHGAQKAVIHEPFRYKKIDGGWRAGKSFAPSVALYLDGLWRSQVRGIHDDIWGVIGDSYMMAQEEMRHLDRLLIEAGIPHTMHTPENQSWRITFPHKPATYHTLTAADVTKIASRPYRGLVIAEAAQTIPEAFTNAMGRVLQTRGWVMLEGTFENQKGPWYGQLTEQWKRPDAIGKRYALPTWDNLLLFPEGRQDPEILKYETSLPPAVFMEKLGGEPQRPSNVVLPEANERYTVKRRFPMQGTSFDPERPVYLFIDPGIAHAYAVLAVQVWASEEYLEKATPETHIGPMSEPPGNVLHVIDAVYRWGHETEQMVEECARRPWAQNVADVVLDFAARQRRAEGAPVVEQWAKYWPKYVPGKRIWCHTNQVPLMAGYEVHRRALLNAWPEDVAQMEFNRDGKMGAITNPAGPRILIDPDASAPFFGGLVDGQTYAGEYNLHVNTRDRQGTVARDEPRDTHNDAIKAMSYGAYWWFGAARVRHQLLGMTSQPFALVS